MNQTNQNRVGLYIRPATRNRLNLYKAKLSLQRDETLSQDDTINALLNAVGEPSAPEHLPESAVEHA